jgi:hypothetical protein
MKTLKNTLFFFLFFLSLSLSLTHTHTHTHTHIGAAVDGDVLRPHALLEQPHLRVLAATTEQAGRLDAEVADLLSAGDELCMGVVEFNQIKKWKRKKKKI